ncbi:MAG: PQQ-dependent sugar dehydrogenase [Bacteroidetes bacterium]|nr:PQQ-dependent sugar dehydrogenase [Bacteroidota bacterium]
MKYHYRLFALFTLLNFMATAQNYMLQPAFPSLSYTFLYPIELKSVPDSSSRMFVVEKHGKIFSIDPAGTPITAKLFLNLSSIVSQSGSSGETGLLGLAFHPDYATNGYFYVNYTNSLSGSLKSYISRFQVSTNNPDSALFSSKLEILNLSQPYGNHNGGCLNFGLDGYLYCAFGDGGSGGDPLGYGQNKTVLLGKILRINVDSAAAPLNYSIPLDNPFYGNLSGYRQEIFTYGMRNTWRFSLDSVSGKMWAGDVGQNAYEEVDILESGLNYGWNVMEGMHCYSASVCDTTLKRKPVWEYPQGSSNYSVTGGYVYRGTTLPALYGKYIYGDYVSGRIWALNYDGINPTTNAVIIDRPSASAQQKTISAFGVDRQNNIYVISYDEGKVYKIAINTTDIPTVSNIQKSTVHQNLPNPFTKQTIFDFDIAQAGNVNLSVYNAYGALVKTLVNEAKAVGSYQVLMDAENMAAGIYYYCLKTNEGAVTKKMILSNQ